MTGTACTALMLKPQVDASTWLPPRRHPSSSHHPAGSASIFKSCFWYCAATCGYCITAGERVAASNKRGVQHAAGKPLPASGAVAAWLLGVIAKQEPNPCHDPCTIHVFCGTCPAPAQRSMARLKPKPVKLKVFSLYFTAACLQMAMDWPCLACVHPNARRKAA